jgi:hypothetical protein
MQFFAIGTIRIETILVKTAASGCSAPQLHRAAACKLTRRHSAA